MLRSPYCCFAPGSLSYLPTHTLCRSPWWSDIWSLFN